MKTSIEIIYSIFETLENAGCGLGGNQRNILRVCMSEWIKTIKQEQDRDTRHACAEIANSIKIWTGNAAHSETEEEVARAHNEIMNSKNL